jgi:hypothetical protein
MDQAPMNSPVIKTILKLGAEALFFTLVVGAAIMILGYVKQWGSSIPYSNAFFIAGILVIVAGTSSKLAASQEWGSFQIYSESFRDMSRSERANYIIEISISYRLAILGLASGIMLILIAAWYAYLK